MEKSGLDSVSSPGGAGAVPPCLGQGTIPCRGCPGWIFMKRALTDPESTWRLIHCPAVGLTVRRENNVGEL
ncbi:MAG: hypothetical protein V1816_08075 [Pseudomonadota bacterium]